MRLEELMADEFGELQESGELTCAGAQPIHPMKSAPRELEFRRGDFRDHSDYRAQRVNAIKRREIEPR